MTCFIPLRLLIKISHQLHVLGNLDCRFQSDQNHSIVKYSKLRLGRHESSAGTMGRLFLWRGYVSQRLLFAQTNLQLTVKWLWQIQIFYQPTYLEWARQLSQYSDWLRSGRSGDRIPVGSTFSAPVQTGRGSHPASCTMGTGSFPGV